MPASNASLVAQSLLELPVVTRAKVTVVTRTMGLLLLADTKRRAARPRTSPSIAGLGPRLQTGNYNRSIGLRVETQGQTISAAVGTNAVQGMRLEQGFQDGRSRTLPHPHFGPSLDLIGKKFVSAMNEVGVPSKVIK